MVMCLEKILTYVCPYCTYDPWPFEYMSKLVWETAQHLLILLKCATVLIIVIISEQVHTLFPEMGLCMSPVLELASVGRVTLWDHIFLFVWDSLTPVEVLIKPTLSIQIPAKHLQ